MIIIAAVTMPKMIVWWCMNMHCDSMVVVTSFEAPIQRNFSEVFGLYAGLGTPYAATPMTGRLLRFLALVRMTPSRMPRTPGRPLTDCYTRSTLTRLVWPLRVQNRYVEAENLLYEVLRRRGNAT